MFYKYSHVHVSTATTLGLGARFFALLFFYKHTQHCTDTSDGDEGVYFLLFIHSWATRRQFTSEQKGRRSFF